MITKNLDPLSRPGLAYQHAFDWLAVRLFNSPGPQAAIVNSRFHALELLRRCPEITLIEPLPAELTADAHSFDLAQINTMPFPLPDKPAALAWIEPRLNNAALFEQVSASLRPGGLLLLVTPGYLAHFLSENRGTERLDQLASTADFDYLLPQNGFQIQERLALHGPRAIAWHEISQLAARFNQKQRRDRAHFAFRRDFNSTTAGPWAALHLIAAERVP